MLEKMKVLLLDASFAAAPIYEALKEEGYDVWVMGNRKNDFLAQLAGNNWINQDYSSLELVKQYVKKIDFKYIIPGCTDISIEICQLLNVNPNSYDVPEIYNQIANKKEFRNLCNLLDLPSPQSYAVESFPQEGEFIIKPVDSFSGRGISVVNGMDMDSLNKGVELAKEESLTGCVVVESYIIGQLYSYSGFLNHGKIKEAFIVKEGSSVNQFSVDTSFVDIKFNIETEELIKKHINNMAHYLNLKDGLIHLQFILSNNIPYFIEVTRRCPGDLYSLLIEYSTGFKYAKKFVSYYVATNNLGAFSRSNSDHIIRHTVSSSSYNPFLGLKFKKPQTIKSFYPVSQLGVKIKPNQETRIGILFVKNINERENEKNYNSFVNRTVLD